MHFCTLLAATALTGFAAAAPAPEVPGGGCPIGTHFYTCFKNGFRGCCSIDPCDLPSCPSTQTPPTTTLIPSVVATSISSVPTTSSTGKPGECTPGQRVSLYNPTMHTIFREKPDVVVNTTNFFYVTQDEGGKNKRDQVMVFKNIPAGAKDCSLLWAAAPTGTNFGYFKTGLTQVFSVKLDGKKFDEIVPEVSYEKVKPITGERVGGADFTFWPQSTQETDHTVGDAACASEMAFTVDLVGGSPGQEGSVVIEQDERTGWYIEYAC
ncbi:hypothetical protein K469DRAFT_705950 [Zopfia rhizophila CBS 207.26]|uniref:Ubiquitin 3 binding protein But2 C-terminal domain-containing protein n=1 Tax=Zopfia rhizophila CBS 207.26 TaxID=1314779 RepID=A0A6A6EWK3_9PEZI|nr:hypothetical protein K469DRAFT_705950 [Zopfia rhizophila CBS 207.26]